MEKVAACIICALAEEATAVKEVLEKQGAVIEKKYSPSQKRDYFFTTLQNQQGEELKIVIIWQARMGMIETSGTIEGLLREFEPRFLAMTGICAGNKKQVKLGDLIVAEKTFIFDSGKFENQEHLHATITFQTSNEVLQRTHMFTEWLIAAETYKESRPTSKHQQRDWLLNQLLERETTIRELYKKERAELETHAPKWQEILQQLLQQKPSLLDEKTWGLRDPDGFIEMIMLGAGDFPRFPYTDAAKPSACIGGLASGNAVRKDNPFSDIEQVDSKILGVDMEGDAVYYVLQEHSDIRFLVVKGVSDYADGNKDDSYHKYAATLSAVYIATFITEFVNDKFMPWSTPPEQPVKESTVTPTFPDQKQPVPHVVNASGKKPVKLFVSCSQSEEDLKLLKKFNDHLAVMSIGPKRLIEPWNPHYIEAGKNEAEEKRKKLDEAQIILLMISPSYYTSPGYQEEIEEIEERWRKGVKLIPILLRPTSFWKDAFSYGDLRSLPRNDEAISQAANKDEALAEIAREIRLTVERIQGE